MSEQPSAFQAARVGEVAKIVYKTLREDTQTALNASQQLADAPVDNSEVLAVLTLVMQLGAAAQRAAQDLQRFGIQAG